MVKQERTSSSKLASTSPDHSASVKYTGVRKRKWGKYVSEIRLPNSRDRIWLGSYDTPEKAARAFDAALFCLRGNNANFNFPEQPPQIPGGRSLPPSQIQAAAARFANHYYSSNDMNLSSSSNNCTTTDDNSSSSSQEDSPSPSLLTTTDMGDTDWTSPFLLDDDFTNSSFMNIIDHPNINSNTNVGVPDFGIFPGFDDYFMTTPPPTIDNDYGEENCDGIYLQDPSFLWNF